MEGKEQEREKEIGCVRRLQCARELDQVAKNFPRERWGKEGRKIPTYARTCI